METDRNETFYDQIQSLLKDKSHKIISVVPLESSNHNRRRHLVLLSAPSERTRNVRNKSSRSQSFSPGSLVTTTRSGASQYRRAGSGRVSASGREEDFCLLGVDSFNRDGERDSVRLGLVVKMLWGTEIIMDGDGGFRVVVTSRQLMFKPACLQQLWTTLQLLHSIIASLRPHKACVEERDEDWVQEYRKSLNSPQSCINEWNEMSDILSRRPLSPDQFSSLSSQEVDQESRKNIMKAQLRHIMKQVDLDDITSKSIRKQLENDLNQNLEEFKSFIDEEILLILGQMDPASKIFDFLYLGSEWNASNLEELTANGVTHILNVTREIDNFFPAVFKYLNIREWDVEESDLLKYWDKTFQFILDCVNNGGKVLVHCKMGISRSAATVVAFALKYFSWSLDKTLEFTKEKRPIVKPNEGFIQQLTIYEGILGASRQRQSFRNRSKSDSFIKTECKKPSKTAYFQQAKENILRNLDLRPSCIKSNKDGDRICLDLLAECATSSDQSVKTMARVLETRLTDALMLQASITRSVSATISKS